MNLRFTSDYGVTILTYLPTNYSASYALVHEIGVNLFARRLSGNVCLTEENRWSRIRSGADKE